jgi:hypothetical protein
MVRKRSWSENVTYYTGAGYLGGEAPLRYHHGRVGEPLFDLAGCTSNCGAAARLHCKTGLAAAGKHISGQGCVSDSCATRGSARFWHLHLRCMQWPFFLLRNCMGARYARKTC